MAKQEVARIRLKVNRRLIDTEFYCKLLTILYTMTGGTFEELSISKYSNKFEIDTSEVASIVPLLDAIIAAITAFNGTPPPKGRLC